MQIKLMTRGAPGVRDVVRSCATHQAVIQLAHRPPCYRRAASALYRDAWIIASIRLHIGVCFGITRVAVSRHSAAGHDDRRVHVVVLVRLTEARTGQDEGAIEQ